MKKPISIAFVSLAFALVSAVPMRAGDINLTLPSYYDSPNGYDFSDSNNYPPTTPTTIGTFTFNIPANSYVTGITLTGTFGNGDSPTTALSDYYLGFAGNETAVEVANCDDISDNCYSDGSDGPFTWTYTATGADLSALQSALNAGSLDFTYTWVNNQELQNDAVPGNLQYVYAGAPTIDIQFTPEPATVLFCFGGLAGIAALRRFRKA